MVIKLQKLKGEVSPFAGISFVNCLFDKSGLSDLIDSELGLRVKFFGYQYSEIIRNLTNVFISGGNCIEDIDTHLKSHLTTIPNMDILVQLVPPIPESLCQSYRSKVCHLYRLMLCHPYRSNLCHPYRSKVCHSYRSYCATKRN